MMNRWILWVVVAVAIPISTPLMEAQSSQNSPSAPAFEFERASLTALQRFYESSASPWLDITYYRLQLDVSTAPGLLTGHITVTGICRADSSGPLVLDLVSTMSVDSVFVGGQRTSLNRNSSSIGIALDHRYHNGELLSADIYYKGNPQATGFGSFEFGGHLGVPWVYSLSEPSGARDWWPCKDDPIDKADSADILVTCDSSFFVGSNGRLVSIVNNGDGTSTTHWHERYPIASYLISVAMTNYARFSNWFRYAPTDSMEVLNYILPEHLADAVSKLPKTIDMLSIYSNLFGLYPFIGEKYGHSEFGSGGAMEHQTMTSTTTFEEDVVSHELAHQWFGDMITCRTWSDLWLNEGFAQYSSALYREKKYGTASYWSYMNAQLNLGAPAAGAIGIPDTSSVRNLFDASRIYNKGACVLHMLRHVLGDTLFFRSLRAYAGDPALRYSTAAIADFESVCESVSGQNLGYFFQEWIYGEGLPTYDYTWSSKPSGNEFTLVINLNQTTSGNPPFFTMPVDFRIHTATGDTVATVFNDSLRQQFLIRTSSEPTSVLIDPDGWILKIAIAGANRPPGKYYLDQNYPNPFNPKTSISFWLPVKSRITLRIYDVLGREIAKLLDENKLAGLYTVDWNSSSAASGIYFYQLVAHPQTGTQTGDFMETKKMVLIK